MTTDAKDPCGMCGEERECSYQRAHNNDLGVCRLARAYLDIQMDLAHEEGLRTDNAFDGADCLPMIGDMKARIKELEGESEGRRKVLLDKANECRKEWARAEAAEANHDDTKAMLAAVRRELEEARNVLRIYCYSCKQDRPEANCSGCQTHKALAGGH